MGNQYPSNDLNMHLHPEAMDNTCFYRVRRVYLTMTVKKSPPNILYPITQRRCDTTSFRRRRSNFAHQRTRIGSISTSPDENRPESAD